MTNDNKQYHKDIKLFAEWFFFSRPEALAHKVFKEVSYYPQRVEILEVMVLSLRAQLKEKEAPKVIKRLCAINEYSHNPSNINKIKLCVTNISQSE